MAGKHKPTQKIWRWKSESRYYIVRIQKNLFGEWSLFKEWGGLRNRKGQLKMSTFSSYEDVLAEINITSKTRAGKSYQEQTQ